MDARIEAAARALYKEWCEGGPPNWDNFDSGADLNGAGLTADHFRQDAIFALPLNDVEETARKLCVANGIPECFTRNNCTPETCTGFRDFIVHARAAVEAASASQ